MAILIEPPCATVNGVWGAVTVYAGALPTVRVRALEVEVPETALPE
jgi:hypothetical protein